MRVGFSRVDLGVDRVVRLARARGAGRGVDLAEVHLVGLGVRIARVGPLVVRIRPLGGIGIRGRLVEVVMDVAPSWGFFVSHIYSSMYGGCR
jgi:hypothetical protein